MGLTKELLDDYQNEEEFSADNNRMLADWEYAETQMPEQIEYIKDNLLSDIDLEMLGFKEVTVNPDTKIPDENFRRELAELRRKYDIACKKSEIWSEVDL